MYHIISNHSVFVNFNIGDGNNGIRFTTLFHTPKKTCLSQIAVDVHLYSSMFDLMKSIVHRFWALLCPVAEPGLA